jgi:putative nucleotidyltransferase with HDIG domain
LFTAQAPIMLLLGFCGGIASGFVVSSILPVFEAGFAYTTDIKLLELANLNHPLLRELILRSPGSYHHSMMVGSLCEAAAEEIGCNSLLARVGAYYHDIGKSKNPGYFAENQKFGENPHDKLKPNMSALIIKAHVKDGIEMARQQRLPKEIIAFIEQHHGTSLISYFYHRAKQLEDPNIPEVNEKDYRYPGPKPQMRETAICLLADGIEAASRSMKVKSPDKLKGLVQTMINRAFTDGQLDECDLTLKDLNAIADAFTRILTGIYHHRPEYPGGKKKETTSTTTKETPAVQEPNRPQRNTGEVAGKESGERPAVKPGRPTKQTPAVKTDKEEKKTDGDRDPDPGNGDEPPEASEDPRDPPEEGRASLPRLGSS